MGSTHDEDLFTISTSGSGYRILSPVNDWHVDGLKIDGLEVQTISGAWGPMAIIVPSGAIANVGGNIGGQSQVTIFNLGDLHNKINEIVNRVNDLSNRTNQILAALRASKIINT